MPQTDPASSPQTKSTPLAAYLCLGIGLLVLGISAILVRAADAPGPVSALYRMLIGSALLTVMAVFQRKNRRFNREGLRFSALAGLLLGVDMVLWTTGIMLSGATMPTLMGNTAPLWVGLGTMLLYREEHPPLFWVGLAVALSGAVIVLGGGTLLENRLDIGTSLGVISAMFYASFFLAAQTARQHTDALTMLWVSTMASTMVIFLATLILNQPLTGFDRQTWLLFFIMGIVIQVSAWLLITYAQGHLPASIVAPTLLGQPVLTAILAVPLLGEVFNRFDLLGGLTTMIGVLLVNFSKQRRKQPLPGGVHAP